VDARVLRQLAGALAGGHVSPQRLAAAVRAVLSSPAPEGVLSAAERELLAGSLFPNGYRDQVVASLVRLDRGPAAPGSRPAPARRDRDAPAFTAFFSLSGPRRLAARCRQARARGEADFGKLSAVLPGHGYHRRRGRPRPSGSVNANPLSWENHMRPSPILAAAASASRAAHASASAAGSVTVTDA
jgi:hypothetical protein